MPQIIIGLGMTETCAIEVMNDPNLPLRQRIDCVGQSIPHVENIIIDPATGCPLPDGQVGELLTRGYHVMAGYYKNEKLTHEAIDADGWMHTGDLCLRNPDGTFQMKGRLKDFINRGGEKIYPREVEAYLHHFDEIKEAQVVSVPDRKYGEEIAAFIVLQKGAAIEKEVLQEYIRRNAASFKVPRYIFFIDEMPLNSNGKVLKYELRKMAAELVGNKTVPGITQTEANCPELCPGDPC